MNTKLFFRLFLLISLAFAFAIGWTIAADKLFHNKVETIYGFQSLYPLSIGVIAVCVSLMFKGSVSDLGLRLPKIKYYFTAIAITLVIAVIPFVLNILLNSVYVNSDPNIDERLLYFGAPAFLILAFAEEIYWRGAILNILKEKFSYNYSSIIIGLLWALWHYPAIFGTKLLYADRPVWFVVLMFTLSSITINFLLVYLRALSKSILPGVVMHGLLNYFLFTLIMPVENGGLDRGIYFTGDIGVFYVSMTIIVALYYCPFAAKRLTARSSKKNRMKKAVEESSLLFDSKLPNESTGA